MTIHSSNPFAETPDQVRRFRGRLGGAVSLWTTGSATDRAGLTVSSLMVANGEPAHVLLLVDPDSDLADVVTRTGRAMVQLLTWPQRDLAEAFAGTAPAPGGPWRMASFVDSPWGPRLADATTWAAVSLESAEDVGWSSLLTCVVQELAVGEEDAPLVHRRGRYVRPEA